jgi:hypothetical protein
MRVNWIQDFGYGSSELPMFQRLNLKLYFLFF